MLEAEVNDIHRQALKTTLVAFGTLVIFDALAKGLAAQKKEAKQDALLTLTAIKIVSEQQLQEENARLKKQLEAYEEIEGC